MSILKPGTPKSKGIIINRFGCWGVESNHFRIEPRLGIRYYINDTYFNKSST
ncbi:MAG: hypothetical protein IPK94_05935 [Saprospiraceae bacterium]|nr:hypothetical protein [Saprospiraceae bacterium]